MPDEPTEQLIAEIKAIIEENEQRHKEAWERIEKILEEMNRTAKVPK